MVNRSVEPADVPQGVLEPVPTRIWATVLSGHFSGRKRAHKHKRFALVNVQMALGQTAGCPRVNRAKKFMCSPRNTGNINLSCGQPAGCPRVVPTFKKSMCSTFMCLFLALTFHSKGGNCSVPQTNHGMLRSLWEEPSMDQYQCRGKL